MGLLGQICTLSYRYNDYYYQYNYNWDANSMDETAFIAVFFGMFMFIIAVALICFVPFYVFGSIGFYTIAKRRGIKAPGLAWVPVANYYIIGGIGDDYQRRKTGKDSKLRIWMLVLGIIGVVLMVIAFTILISSVISLAMSDIFVNDMQYEDEMILRFAMSMIGACLPLIIAEFVMIACVVLYYISLYRLYKAASPDMAVVLTVLSVIFSVIIPFVVFALRNKDEGLPAQSVETPAQLQSGADSL
ncbi:MAG: hypothetical protein HFE78_05215 [Clostridiales bacterium]|nr:hypothetical protein [Clostridiales bacterium]